MSRRKLADYSDAERRVMVAREMAPDTGDLARGNSISYGPLEEPANTPLRRALLEGDL